jgi:hypothetical protein
VATIDLDTTTRSTVSMRTVANAMNGMGGPVWRWREAAMQLSMLNAIATAPINNPLNAMHRGGKVGEYKRSFSSSRIGSNQYQLRFTIKNSAAHAGVVEEGRKASNRNQVFSWTRNSPPGSVRLFKHTRSRPGKYIIQRAVRAAVAATT